jgi:chromosome segregation ATPase
MTPVESIQSHLAELGEDLARSVEAHTEMAASLETAAAELVALREGQAEIQLKLGELSDEVGRMIALFRDYVRETNTLRSEVREKLRAAR